ncbi:MAG: LytTR family transcriptional regulator, partial [Chitinophagaceae bacterium]|nr:LytTR family transcriptional regulator [Chitinophagaceae bacterium]
AALKIVTVLNSSDDQVDIMKLCRLRCNYFLRRVWLDNIHLYTSMLAASADYYNSILYYKPYQWLRDVGALVAFDYSMIRHLDFIMQNKLRDEIVALTREDEDQLDYQASLIWDYLDKLLLMENNLRLGLAVKSPPKQTILLKQGDRLDAVYIESILKIEADGNYIYVHYINGSVSLRYSSTIKELKRITINTPICKVNKYTMINLRLVRSVKSDVISLGENHDVTLSPLCRKEFFRRFGE